MRRKEALELKVASPNVITLDPAGAVDAGFLDRLVPEGEAIDAAVELAAQLAKLPTKAYAGNKLVPRQQSLKIMAASLGL